MDPVQVTYDPPFIPSIDYNVKFSIYVNIVFSYLLPIDCRRTKYLSCLHQETSQAII